MSDADLHLAVPDTQHIHHQQHHSMEDVSPAAAASSASHHNSDIIASSTSSSAAASSSASSIPFPSVPVPPKKPRAPRASPNDLPIPIALGASARGRERKSTAVYTPDLLIHKEEDDFIVETGKGALLGSMEGIKHRMDGTNALEPEMKALFHACFPYAKGSAGNTKLIIKRNIRAFSGYVQPKEDKVAAAEKLEKYDGNTLKLVTNLLGISESGSKSKLIETITDFLAQPNPEASAGIAAGKVKKRVPSSKKKKNKWGIIEDEKPKRGPSSFILFSNEQRDKLKAKHPELGMKEIAIKLGEKWRALTDEEKDKWKKLAGGEGDETDANGEPAKKKQKTKNDQPPHLPLLPSAAAMSTSSIPIPVIISPDVAAAAAAAAATSMPMSLPISIPLPAAAGGNTISMIDPSTAVHLQLPLDIDPLATLSDEWRTKFTEAISAQIDGADLADLSIGKVNAHLATLFGELVVDTNKAAIRALVMHLIKAKTSKQQ